MFVGGGTPTLLPADELARLLDAHPARAGRRGHGRGEPRDRSTAAGSRALRAAGATRLSLGMQSASPHVLATLERRHTPGARRRGGAAGARGRLRARVARPHLRHAGRARRGLGRVARRRGSRPGVDHVSAYALTVEPGTRLHARVRRGALPAPDDDAAGAPLPARPTRRSRAAGLAWYEVCNWAAGPGARCAHNLGYWRSHDWWGLGPGAHSHVGGVRWWNVLHPGALRRARARRGALAGRRPGAAHGRAAARLERTMLGIRLAEGLALDAGPGRPRPRLAADGLLDAAALARGVARLTLEGRIAADRVALALA